MSSKKPKGCPSRRFYEKAKKDAERELFALDLDDVEHIASLPPDGNDEPPVQMSETLSMPGCSQEQLEATSSKDDNRLDSRVVDLDFPNLSSTIIIPDLENNSRTIPNIPSGSNLDGDKPSWSLSSFKTEFVQWAVEENVALSKVSKLLKILKKHEDFNELPADARSLLKTPRKTDIVELCGGNFVYFGVVEGIKKILQNETTLPDTIELLVGIDGLPISKSSTSQLWPQLGKIRSLPHAPMFVIGIFHGSEKPNNATDFLSDLVNELKICIENGIQMNDKTVIVSHVAFVCDAPAKSFILQTKGHSGYYSCTRCKDEGRYLNQRVCFSTECGAKRTHAEFVDQREETFHVGDSILIDIPGFDVVRDVPLDYMHLVCLGVLKKILNLWLKGKLSCRLSGHQQKNINKILKSFRPYVPSDFVRKPRGLEELPRWKATELRFFLLYSGPVLLAKLRDFRPEIAENFMCLSTAMILLLSPSNCYLYQDYAKTLLECFVVNFKKLYGEHLVSHNVHGLLHLSDDVTTFGALDNCSAFHFENFLQTLKTLMRKHHLPLQQVSNRIKEQSLISFEGVSIPEQHSFKYPHSSGPLTGVCTNPQYKTLLTPIFKISNNHKDCFCMLSNNKIVKAKNFAFCPQRNCVVLIGVEYEGVQDIFKKPFKSSRLNISVIRKTNGELGVWSVEDIQQKMIVLPFRRNLWAAMPIIHMK